MKIRLAEEQDLDRVVDISLKLHAESRFAGYPANLDKVRKSVATLIGNPVVSCVLLAEHDTRGLVGLLAGYATELFFTDVVVAQDKWYYVLPEHRGGSAAVKLLIAFRRWAENRRARELSINMSVAIDPARFNRFMRHMGFACCGSNFVLPLNSGVVR